MQLKSAWCLALLLLVTISGVAAIDPVRRYTFDSDGDVSDRGLDGIPLSTDDPASVTYTSSGCPAGHSGCVFFDTSNENLGTPTFSTPIVWTGTGTTLCFWYKGIENAFMLMKTEATSDCSISGLDIVRYGSDRWLAYVNTGTYLGFAPYVQESGWTHMCFAFGVGIQKIYSDGNLIGTTFASEIPSGSNTVYFGPDGCRQASFFLDDIQFFNEFLTPEEVMSAQNPGSISCNPSCQANAFCNSEASCTCLPGYDDANGDASVCANKDECLDESDGLAYCDDTDGSYECTCPEGFIGDGVNCQSNSWSVRAVCQFQDVSALDRNQIKLDYARAITGDFFQDGVYNITLDSPVVETSHVEIHPTGNLWTINALFYTESDANAALGNMDPNYSFASLGGCILQDGPDVYTWSGKSTGDPIEVVPSGFEVESMFFDSTCLNSGCWTIDITFTIGTNDFNTFFLPEAVGNSAFSSDFDYGTKDSVWTHQSPADTFFPVTHPCTSADFDATGGLTAAVSSCCLDQFFAMYCPIDGFVSAVGGDTGSNCSVGERLRQLNPADVKNFAAGSLVGDGTGPAGVYVAGVFSGMTHSYGQSMGVVDPYVGIYKARFFLDEVETRDLAGQLRGSVGIEYTVDTFLGQINLGPTGTATLDTFVTQVGFHLEKTSFFSVSTHGTNDYTFLEYINLRLVTIFLEDSDFSGTDESGAGTVRTDSTRAADYVQVTFTLGSQYGVNSETDFLPLSSVRAGSGTFIGETALDHKCTDWDAGSFDQQSTFLLRLGQTCAPAATMCDSPSSIPDSFVSFNIPLGIDAFPAASSTLSNNVFVDMVISATDSSATGIPNDGSDPKQMKTTLTASIPVVEGGVNIFCDGYTSKTDLKDVVNVDIVVGSASSSDELTALAAQTGHCQHPTFARHDNSDRLGQHRGGPHYPRDQGQRVLLRADGKLGPCVSNGGAGGRHLHPHHGE